MKFTKKKLTAIILAVCILAAAFILQGTIEKSDVPDSADSAPSSSVSQGETGKDENNSAEAAKSDKADEENKKDDSASPDDAEKDTQSENASEEKADVNRDETRPSASSKDDAQNPPDTETKPEPQPEPEEKALTCTLFINCSTILNNMELLTPGKEDIIPSDGYLLYVSDAEFTQGETAFDVFRRELQKRNIHFEFSNSALYDTAYIEGIGNIYEFDCGELSGWEYSVNGFFPGYGCSKYTLSDGDTVAFLYTCDLGKDVGNSR